MGVDHCRQAGRAQRRQVQIQLTGGLERALDLLARFVVHDGHEIGAKIPVGQAARGDGDEVALANGQVPRGADDESIGGEALAGGCDLGTGVLQEHGSLFPPGGVSARLFAHDVTRAVWFESALMSRPLIFKKYLDG